MDRNNCSVESLLKGCYDMHLHGSPSVAARQSSEEMIVEMSRYGYAGFVLKDHYVPSTEAAILFNRFMSFYGVRVYGSIILNNSVGGINMYAVDAAYQMGTKIISLPSISARAHVEYIGDKYFAGRGNMIFQEKDDPIYILDGNGRLIPEVTELLDYAKERPDIVLYTGHVSAKEAEVFICEAAKRGAGNIYANHPYWLVGATLEQMKYWTEMGAYIEINQSVVSELAANAEVPASMIRRMIDELPIEQLIATTDLGQISNVKPVQGMIRFLNYMIDTLGITADQIVTMIRQNPAKLLAPVTSSASLPARGSSPQEAKQHTGNRKE